MAFYVASEEISGPRETSGPAWLSLGHLSYLRHSTSWSQGQEDQQVSLRGVMPSLPKSYHAKAQVYRERTKSSKEVAPQESGSYKALPCEVTRAAALPSESSNLLEPHTSGKPYGSERQSMAGYLSALEPAHPSHCSI